MGDPHAPERVRAVAYGEGVEAQAIRMEIGSFEWESSMAYDTTRRLFGPHLRLIELKGIVLAVRQFIKMRDAIELPRLSRNAKRSLPLLIKYIDANAEHMIPMMHKVSLCDRDKVRIGIAAARRPALPE